MMTKYLRGARMKASQALITAVTCILLSCIGAVTGGLAAEGGAPQTTHDWIGTLSPLQRGAEDCPEVADSEKGGEPIVTVQFATGTANLTEASQSRLEQLALAMASDCLKNSDFELKWYPGSASQMALDSSLEEQRSAAVRDFLIQSAGLSPTSITMIRSKQGTPAGGSRDSIVAEVKRFDRN